MFSEVPPKRGILFLELTTLEDYPDEDLHWNFIEKFQNRDTKNLEIYEFHKQCFIFKRVNPKNMMHVLHDDFIGLYHTIRYFSRKSTPGNPDFASFDEDVQIQFLDDFPAMDDFFYKILTKNPLSYKKDLKNLRKIVRFHEAILGISRIATWYQYGFKIPQGPIKGKNISGLYVRQAANFIMHKLNIVDRPAQDSITIISRTVNRLIVNEVPFANYLNSRFPSYNVGFLRNEISSLKEQISLIRRSKIVIGMHGAMLIFSMFLQPKSLLVELYPYAVPPENYTPYKTLCNLPGFNVIYKHWVNTDIKKTVEHPEYPKEHGGTFHLQWDKLEKILLSNTVPPHLCCSDPAWLFRIYQDTWIELEEVGDLIESGLEESKSKNFPEILQIWEAGAIQDISCEGIITSTRIGAIVTGVTITWSEPWNSEQSDYFQLWEHVTFRHYETNRTTIEIYDRTFNFGSYLKFWITPFRQGVSGKQSGPFECQIPFTTKY